MSEHGILTRSDEQQMEAQDLASDGVRPFEWKPNPADEEFFRQQAAIEVYLRKKWAKAARKELYLRRMAARQKQAPKQRRR